MPISYVKVSDVISYKFGETLKNISDVFNDPQASLIFIDEFDAFAKSRFDSNDVGELKRIVNSLIQTLDMLPSNKIVIVATNLIDTIDPAIARRFSLKIHVSKLNKRERKEFVDYLIGKSKIPIVVNEKELQSFNDILQEAGLSTVDSIKGVIDTSFLNAHIEKKDSVNLADIASSMLTSGILDSSTLKKIGEEKPVLYNMLMDVLSKDFSKSDIADLIGVHRNSLGNYAKEI
jgi:AAA+ superfamily predicted ATPase